MHAVDAAVTGAWVTLLHLGALHAHEKLLVALVAFGPFVVLFALVFYVRRRDARDDG
ncbi:MAG: hypothetical protein ACTHKG_02465 [Nocardioides sp.]